MSNPKAAILGVSGHYLSKEEVALFQSSQPLGFILFARNIQHKEQVISLVKSLKEAVGREDCPILIDQEGGRVARLKPPLALKTVPVSYFGKYAENDLDKAVEALKIYARIMAEDLHQLGINVNCAPVLDIFFKDLPTTIIGDRAFSSDKTLLLTLANAMVEGLKLGGIMPVMKHIPGHGRATLDSHFALPIIDDTKEILMKEDFSVFAAMNHLPWAMTAHIVYSDIDPMLPATQSSIILKMIREELGFMNIIITDDIHMNALQGTLKERAHASLKAGCDIILNCHGTIEEKRQFMQIMPELDSEIFAKINMQLKEYSTSYVDFDYEKSMESLAFFYDFVTYEKEGSMVAQNALLDPTESLFL